MTPARLELSRLRSIIPSDLLPVEGRVSGVIGFSVLADGPALGVGSTCELRAPAGNARVPAEIVGFRDGQVILMPLGDVQGIGPGWTVSPDSGPLRVPVGDGLLGRVLDGLARPIDGKGDVASVGTRPVTATPPGPLSRPRIERPLSVGVRAIDALLTCGCGQRVGIFAGSGVGKSTLLGTIARNTSADVIVIGLIGERGREVREFIERDLGEGLDRSVVVAATSDQSALVRLKGAFVATAIAEHFRDQGLNVLLLIDSITRFAMAQREIGLAAGEPPATRGYPPSVFGLLPKLLERAGTAPRGTITAFYTVLVDGDDFNEPISDATRGILDGHIILSREIAARSHYPAIDILASVSRLMPSLASEKQRVAAARVRGWLSTYRDAEDLIAVGAYKAGSSPEIDEAVAMMPEVLNFLRQGADERSDLQSAVERLCAIAREAGDPA